MSRKREASKSKPEEVVISDDESEVTESYDLCENEGEMGNIEKH